MKINDCFKLEDGNLQLLLSPNLVANYNHQSTDILHIQSPIAVSTLPKLVGRLDTQLLTINNKASLLPKLLRRFGSLCHLLQRSTVEPLLPKLIGRFGSQLPLMNQILSYFGVSVIVRRSTR